MTYNKQIEHFRKVSEEYVKARRCMPATVAFLDYLNERMLTSVPDSELGESVLDNMCGAADMLEAVQGRFDRLFGVDLSLKMLNLASDRLRRNCQGLMNGDAKSLPLRSKVFDVVFCRGGIHHILKKFHKDVVAEVYRILKPGGYFVFAEPCDDSLLVRAARRALYMLSAMFDEEEETGLRTAEICQVLREAGFEVRKIERFGYIAYALLGQTDVFPYFGVVRNRRLLDLLIELDKRSPGIPLWRRLNLAIIVSAQKAYGDGVC